MSIPPQMMGIIVEAPGGPEVMRLGRLPTPVPGPGELLIEVAAAGVNAPDLAQRGGHYDPPPGASPILGLEVSGLIRTMGEDVTGFAIGDAVVALTNGGGYAEYVAAPAGQVLPLPQNWNLIDAAALPETWFTIMQTIVMRAGLAAGHWLLVHGAAGGIGGAAIGMANILGARAIAVVSSREKAAYAESLGAAAAIDHTSEDFVARALVLTEGHGADIILDMMGGAVTARNVEAAARGGHIVLVSAQAGGKGELPLGKIVQKQLTLSGSTLRPQNSATKAAIAARLKRDIWPALAQPDFVRPKIIRFAIAEAEAAHRLAETRTHFGKIVLLTDFGKSLPN